VFHLFPLPSSGGNVGCVMRWRHPRWAPASLLLWLTDYLRTLYFPLDGAPFRLPSVIPAALPWLFQFRFNLSSGRFFTKNSIFFSTVGKIHGPRAISLSVDSQKRARLPLLFYEADLLFSRNPERPHLTLVCPASKASFWNPPQKRHGLSSAHRTYGALLFCSLSFFPPNLSRCVCAS